MKGSNFIVFHWNWVEWDRWSDVSAHLNAVEEGIFATYCVCNKGFIQLKMFGNTRWKHL